MKNSSFIPLVYYHFGNPPFLKRIIQQAQSLQKERLIFLIGDQSNYKTANELKITFVESSKLLESAHSFEKNYIHLSPSTKKFEVGCLLRWIAMAELMKQFSLEHIFHSDSDYYLLKSPETFSNWHLFPFSYSHDIPERYGYSAHFSYWKRESLENFSNFIQASYSNEHNRQQLKSIYLDLKKEFKDASISDMTLLKLFSETTKDTPLSTANPVQNALFDHNLNVSKNGDYFYETQFGMKKIIWKKNTAFFKNSADASLVEVYGFHFQGPIKKLILARKWLPFIVYLKPLLSAYQETRLKLRNLISKFKSFPNAFAKKQ